MSLFLCPLNGEQAETPKGPTKGGGAAVLEGRVPPQSHTDVGCPPGLGSLRLLRDQDAQWCVVWLMTPVQTQGSP